MSEIKTYTAPTMQDALSLVRAELGSDAVILHTKQQALPRWLPWQKKQHEVEITATVNKTAKTNRSQNAIANTYAKAVSADNPKHKPSPQQEEHKTFGDLIRENQDGVELALSTIAKSAANQNRQPQQATKPSRQEDHKQILADTQSGNRKSPIPPRITSETNLSSEDLTRKLEIIQHMLQRLDHNQTDPLTRDIPAELFDIYTQLIDSEVESQVARDVIFQLKAQADPQQLSNPNAIKAMSAAWLESQFQCTPPIQPRPGQRKVISLIGPTGVGKTTTIAKLAANFRIRDGIKMGLVTVDTYRIAAVEQLRTYAEIIDLPMKVVTNPIEMRRALDEMMGLDLVLIDTAGRSPRDDLKIKELKSLLAEADVDEVLLVLSLTSGLKNLISTAEQFAEVNTSALILTKLDEAIGPGALLNVARNINLPISYITTGQNVPDDIEVSNPKQLTSLVLESTTHT